MCEIRREHRDAFTPDEREVGMSDLWHRVPETTLCHHLGTQTGEAIQRGRRAQMRLPRVRPGPNTVFEVMLAGDEHFWRVPGVRRAPVVLTETA